MQGPEILRAVSANAQTRQRNVRGKLTVTRGSSVLLWMHPATSRDLSGLGPLDHVDGRCVAALFARLGLPRWQSGFPERRRSAAARRSVLSADVAGPYWSAIGAVAILVLVLLHRGRRYLRKVPSTGNQLICRSRRRHSSSTTHLGLVSKRPARFSSSSRHNITPIVIRGHFWRLFPD